MRDARRRWVAVVMVTGILTTACGDDGSGLGPGGQGVPDDAATTLASGGGGEEPTADDPTATGEQADLEATAAAMFEAFLAGDDQTWFDALSEACREALGYVAVQSHLDGRRFRIGAAGISLGDLGVGAVAVDGFDGREAMVALTLEGTTEMFTESVPQRWIVEDGGWRLDDCADIEPTGDNLAGFGAEASAPAEYGFVVDADGFLVTLRDVNLANEELVVELGGSAASDGGQIVTAQVSVDYVGAAPEIVLGDELSFELVSGDRVYGEESSCAGTGDSWFDPGLTLGPGDDSPYFFVCHEVDPGDVDGLLLRIERMPTGEDWWFTLG